MLAPSKKYSIETYFKDEIEPGIRYSANTAEADELFDLYIYDLDTAMKDGGWDLYQRDEGLDYARSLLESWKHQNFVMKQKPLISREGIGKYKSAALGLMAGAAGGWLIGYLFGTFE